jgi:hypothetical protein
MRVVAKTMAVLAWLVLLPVTASAQAVITGIVRDASGAILPGVTVEATSPALIEKVRTAVSDGSGLYRIEDLRPGSYAVTFTLAGFSVLKREGIELTGSFTATINVELRVGALEETITVTGESPVVDVQSARREVTLNSDVLRAIPTIRNYNAVVLLVPGVITNTNDVLSGATTTQFPIHGGRNNEGRLMIDGLNIGTPVGGNQPPGYIADIGNAQEITFTTSGGLGESETAGLIMNVVPRTGGNRYSGSLFFSGTGESLQSSNYTEALRLAGLTQAIPLRKVYDLNAAVGGPIVRDRVWFWANARTQGSTRGIASVYVNQNAGDATKWLYSPDLSQPAFSDRTWENVSTRVTWQMTPRNKIGGFWDEQRICRECEGMTQGITDPARVSPEAIGNGSGTFRVPQVTWSSPVTNRLLLDAGFGGNHNGYGHRERRGNETRGLIRVSEQCAGGCPANGNIPGLVYRSQDWLDAWQGSWNWRASASFVTGSHSLKAGYQGNFLTDDQVWHSNDENLAYRLNNGIPNQLTMYIAPYQRDSRASFYGVYVQDQWTLGRLTLQSALRFDRARSWFPEQQEGPSRFLPQQIRFPRTDGVNSYNDFSPRVGIAYDLFGTGRTAIKANVGRYLEGAGIQLNFANPNPAIRLPGTGFPRTVTRAWTDANSNFQPDCDLLVPGAQDLRGSGGDFCGALSNLRFGQNVFTNTYDDALLHGWGVRSADWNISAAVQQQLMARMSVEVSYNRRWFSGFTLNDNLLTQSADYTPFSITAPSDPRLPGGGGYPISGLYDVNPGLFGQISDFITNSKNFGAWTQYYNGMDVTLNLRTQGGLTVQGGMSTGQTVSDACEVRANLPELAVNIGAGLQTSAISQTSPYCHVATGLLTQWRGLATYTVPRVEVQVSGVFQSKPGPALAANYAVPSSVITAALGRPPAGSVPNLTVNLIEPGTLYGDRLNQVDLRAAKILRFGGTKTMIGLDLYNVFNSSVVLTYNNAFVPNGTWLQPNSILTGRLARISAELTW